MQFFNNFQTSTISVFFSFFLFSSSNIPRKYLKHVACKYNKAIKNTFFPVSKKLLSRKLSNSQVHAHFCPLKATPTTSKRSFQWNTNCLWLYRFVKSEPFEMFGDVLDFYGSRNWVEKIEKEKRTNWCSTYLWCHHMRSGSN